MKVRVNRELVEGRYQVSFQVGDFTSEEVKKMSQFGTPAIIIMKSSISGNVKLRALITQIPDVVAAFSSEQDAKEYEAGILNNLKTSIEKIRELVDKFTSSEEIAL